MINNVIKKFLFDYRNTKHFTTKESPAKLLMMKQVIWNKLKYQRRNVSGKHNTKYKKRAKIIFRDYYNLNKNQLALLNGVP